MMHGDAITSRAPAGSSTALVASASIGQGCCNPADLALNVVGTPGNDTINITPAGPGAVNVWLNSVNQGTFPKAKFQCVVILARAGNDMVFVSPGANVPAIVYGGAGSDTIISGGQNDILFGQAGNDAVLGGGGEERG